MFDKDGSGSVDSPYGSRNCDMLTIRLGSNYLRVPSGMPRRLLGPKCGLRAIGSCWVTFQKVSKCVACQQSSDRLEEGSARQGSPMVTPRNRNDDRVYFAEVERDRRFLLR